MSNPEKRNNLTRSVGLSPSRRLNASMNAMQAPQWKPEQSDSDSDSDSDWDNDLLEAG